MSEEFPLSERELKALTPAQLIEAYQELNQAYNEAEEDLRDREMELKSMTGKKGKGPKRDEYSNEDELNRLTDRCAEQDAIIADKQDKIEELNQKVKALKEEVTEAKRIENKQSDQIAALQKEINLKANEGQATRSLTADLKKQKAEAMEESRKQSDENARLQETIEKLESTVELYADQNEKMQEHIQVLTEKHDYLQEHKDTNETRYEELEVQVKELADRLERTQEELLAAQDDGEWIAQIQDLKRALKHSQDQAASDAKNSRSEVNALQEKVKSLSSDTLIGKKVKELESQQAQLKENLQLLDEMAKQLTLAEKGRAEAVESLRRVEESIEQRVAERVLAEREKNRHLERTLAGLMSKTSDESEKHRALDKENTLLHREVDELTNWKTIYEAGHGLQGLQREQKKQKDENRRLSVSIEQMSAKLGVIMDANGMLTQAFDRLKIECGKAPSFAYPEYELSEEMKAENARLQSQLNEVEDQMGALETDNTRLRKALKSQAGSIGEQGFKYAGMSPEQLVKVNEFASNLRDGKIELPVDDRSAKLLKENKRIREDRDSLQMQVQRYERELLGGGGMPAGGSRLASDPALARAQEAELGGLREDMRKLLSENSELRERMGAMQSEIMLLLRQSAGKSDTRNEDIEAMLLAHNEQLSRQMQELKNQTISGLQLTAQQLEQQQHLVQQAAVKAETEKKPSKQKHQQTPAGARPPKHQKPALTIETPVAAPAPTPIIQYIQTPFMAPPTGYMTAPHPYAGPGTPHGKALLGKTLSQLNLPPEDWAEDVKDINGQLVECLEQLFERERELEESSALVAGLEDSLVAIKQQMASVYYDFAQRSESWEAREKEMKAANISLHNERDDLQLKVRRMQEVTSHLNREDPKSIEDKLMEVSRKLTIYEVNEAILARKYTSQAEQLANEQQTRERIEANFVEMESLLKKRILYLEHYKLSAGSRLGYLQGRVDSSVPQGDYLELQTELECLREEHLKALRREVDARVTALHAKEQAAELRILRATLAHLEADLTAARSSANNLAGQLEHQKEYTTRALSAAGHKSSSELSSIISEMAKYRGETGRLEVELAAATRRAEAISEQMALVSKEAAESAKSVAELEQREEEASAKESLARKAKLEMDLRYQGGLTREEADDLRHKMDKCARELEDAAREASRSKELAEIATQQAQTMGQFKSAHAEELAELREHCIRLESRSDDDILIGKLQRQLMATKTSYKAFVAKYQHLRGNMRTRELAVRTLETRLDQREETVIKMQEAHRLQVQALKKALRTVQNSAEEEAVQVSGSGKQKGRAGVKFVTIGQKLMQMSARLKSLADLAEQAMKKAATAESENLSLEGMLQDLQAEKELLSAQARDLEALHLGGKSKQQAVAARLVSLSEDVRVNKLACLQQRRQIQVLRSEKKHLQQLLSNFEQDMESLEEGRVMAETKNLLTSLPREGSDGKGGRALGESLDGLDLNYDSIKPSATIETAVPPERKGKPLTVKVDDVDVEFASNSDPELLERIEVMASQLATVSKEASTLKLQSDRYRTQIDELQNAVQEREGQVQYYERVARSEGLPLIGSGSAQPQNNQGSNRQLKQMKEEQTKLQEAASTTISSLKALLEEKNRLIDSYRKKVEESGGEKRVRSRADKKADELLQRLNEGERASPTKVSRRVDSDDLPAAHRQLLEQVEQADAILMEKDRIVSQLEQKLAQQMNQRERAEVRCGTSIKEMEAMKGDMVTLAQQLQMAEEKLRRMTGRPVGSADPGDKKLVDLQKLTKAKDDKIRSYREIIIRLKEEFIKNEEDQAIAAVTAATKASRTAEGGSTGLDSDAAHELKSQIGSLRDGLKQAKEDLEAARKTREKLAQARNAAVDESERLKGLHETAKAQCASVEESLQRVRKDLEDSRRKEARLRDKLKESLEAEGGKGSDKAREIKVTTDKLAASEREIELLRAQNVALRRAQDEAHGSTSESKSPSPLHNQSTLGGRSTVASSSARPGSRAPPGEFPAGPGGDGRTLGLGDGPQDELRTQLHAKWENEKKLQKRIIVVEKRLQEKLDENEELQGQLKRARDALQQAQHAKDDAQKKAAAAKNASGATAGGQGVGKPSLDDILQQEQASARIFSLEEQLALMRRKAEVEQPNEIASLRHRVSVLQSRVGELEVDIEEADDRRKKATTGGRTLRDSEDRFMREERLKDDLDIARRQRLELEAALLDRDARAIENRFDLESKDAESERLRKRVRELEAAYRSAAAATGAKFSSEDRSGATGTVKGAASGAQRERDLEGVIDAMKRVVDKLKAENDRLKKSAGGDTKAADADKKAAAEKKRADKLEDDLRGMAAKLKGHEESSQKLMQKQEQVNKLRKQLKQKEDEVAAMQTNHGVSSDELENLRRKLQSSESRVHQLESSLQQADSKATRAASLAATTGTAGAANKATDKEMEALRRRAVDQAADLETLRGELSTAQRQLAAAENGSGGAGAGAGTNPAAFQAELRQLREENKNLRQELSAFDLDFFEEIEDLKNAHAEAVRKLRTYEGGSAGGRGNVRRE